MRISHSTHFIPQSLQSGLTPIARLLKINIAKEVSYAELKLLVSTFVMASVLGRPDRQLAQLVSGTPTESLAIVHEVSGRALPSEMTSEAVKALSSVGLAWKPDIAICLLKKIALNATDKIASEARRALLRICYEIESYPESHLAFEALAELVMSSDDAASTIAIADLTINGAANAGIEHVVSFLRWIASRNANKITPDAIRFLITRGIDHNPKDAIEVLIYVNRYAPDKITAEVITALSTEGISYEPVYAIEALLEITLRTPDKITTEAINKLATIALEYGSIVSKAIESLSSDVFRGRFGKTREELSDFRFLPHKALEALQHLALHRPDKITPAAAKALSSIGFQYKSRKGIASSQVTAPHPIILTLPENRNSLRRALGSRQIHISKNKHHLWSHNQMRIATRSTVIASRIAR